MMLLSSFYRAVFLSWLLLAIVEESVTVSGQGVTVDLNGVTLPNDSLVDFDDIPNVSVAEGAPGVDVLNCRTDLEACCNAAEQNLPAPVGEWYYPNGTALVFDAQPGGTTFRRNRLLMNVRLWRRGTPLERGRFHCEVPNAHNVNQTVYVNILNIGPVTITASGGSNIGIAGTSFSLVCSATVETQTDTPTPNFDWFFGTNNYSLPSGATPMATVMGNTYTSTLQFSPLQESHAGMYTCRLGSNARLAINAMVTVNRPDITVTVSASGSPVLGQRGYSLTCDVTGDENLSSTRTYQWTRDNGTMTQVGTNSNSLSFSSLSLSDAGRYTCSVTVSSPYLNSNVMALSSSSEDVMFEIPNPSITLTSNPPSPILAGRDVAVSCAVEMAQGVVDSDLSLLVVDAQLSRDGTPLTLTVTGTTFTYTIQLDSFGRNDSGNYTCSATVRPQSSSTYLTGSGQATTVVEIVVGTLVLPPPLNVQATQSSASAPVEVSWSPPSSGATNITGYRIFYGNGKNVLLPSVNILGYVGLRTNKDSIGENVSVRSEANQLFSELVTVTVTMATPESCPDILDTSGTDRSPSISSCSSEVGVAVGGTILLVCLIVAVVSITVVLCWRRISRSETKIAVSANMAYGEVNLEPLGGGEGGVYEDPEKMLSSGGGNDRQTDYSTDHEYEPTRAAETNKATAQEYESAEEILVHQ